MPLRTVRPYIRTDKVGDELHVTVCRVLNRNVVPYERFVVKVGDVEALEVELARVYAKLRVSEVI